MKTLQTLKLSAHSIASAEPGAHLRPAPEPVVAQRPAPRKRSSRFAERLVALLALEAVAILATLAAAGASHGAPVRIALAFAAFGVAVSILAGLAVRLKRSSAAASRAEDTRTRFGTTNAILVLMMCAGIAAYFGGAATFAGFTAET
ncbi:MAG TPA: hypothetical protein VII54_05865, partial [Gaiellaceae bacterium]